jgi:HSP20 family molecular chaperone IbpA
MSNEQIERTNKDRAENVKQRPAVAPRVDVFENEQEYLVLADLPGVTREGLSLNIHEDQLTLEARRNGTPAGNALATEFKPLDYRRSFTLPQGVDREKVDAELKQGVLRLRLPKAEALRPRQVPVRTA